MRNVLVLMGDGINSENELTLAFSRQGAEVKKIHVNELLERPELLRSFQLLALPGGFSFGDEIRSGKILAEKLRDKLGDALRNFLAQDGRVIGICNGFQVLGQLGLFSDGQRSFTLAVNDHGKFMDKWTKLLIAPNPSPWFQDISGDLYLPVRHKEGRIVCTGELHPVLSYETPINGSHLETAGVTDKSGNIFGLMPHPEVATQEFLHPFRQGAKENMRKVQKLFLNGLS